MSETRIDFTRFKDTVNDAYWPLFTNPVRYLLYYGGAGSGKSVAAAQKVLFRVCTEEKHRFLCIRKVARTLRTSVFPLLLDLIDQWWTDPKTGINHALKDWEVNRSEMKFVFKPNGNEIICMGLDDPEKIKSIHGVTSIWLEEPTELSEADLRELNRRLRGLTANYKQFLLSFNPISERHWLRKQFFDGIDSPSLGVPFLGSRRGSVCLRTTYLHNQFIDDEYKLEMEGLRDDDLQEYRIYTKAEWGVLTGLIYRQPEIGFPPAGIPLESTYGLDFGFNDPSTLLHLGVDRANRRLYVDEVLYKRKLTNRDLMGEIKMALVDRPRATIYADEAEPDRIKEGFRDFGLPIRACKKGKGSVKMGIDLCQRYTIVATPQSQNFLNEMAAYRWKVLRDGEAREEPYERGDHTPDAMRYGIFGRYGGGVVVSSFSRRRLGF